MTLGRLGLTGTSRAAEDPADQLTEPITLILLNQKWWHGSHLIVLATPHFYSPVLLIRPLDLRKQLGGCRTLRFVEQVA